MKRMAKPDVSRWVTKLPEGAVPVRARLDESSVIWMTPEDAGDQRALAVCWVGPAKRGFWQTLLGSALARGTWMDVPVATGPSTEPTVKKKSFDQTEVKGVRRLRIEPYNPEARDGDNDGIVQEGTAWERPAGTRILDEAGKEIKRGLTANRRSSSHRVVDADGKDVDYTPTYGNAKPSGRGRISRSPSLGRTIGDLASPGPQRRAVPEHARHAASASKPSLLNPKGVRKARAEGRLKGLPEDPRTWPPRLPWRPGRTQELRDQIRALADDYAQRLERIRTRRAEAIRQEFQKIRGFTDPPAAERRKLQQALKDLEEKYGGQEGLVARLAELEGERQRAIIEEIRRQPMVISVQPDRVVSLLDDGRYRTQFETGRSGGSYDPDHRRQVERRHGVPAETDVDTIRPVYGSIVPLDGNTATVQGPTKYHALPGIAYGSTTIFLREKVRGRSTISFGDSFGGHYPIPLLGDLSDDDIDASMPTYGQDFAVRARHEAFATLLEEVGYTREDAIAYRLGAERNTGTVGPSLVETGGMSSLAGEVTSTLDSMGAGSGSYWTQTSYIELQVHGGVTLHDVAEIHVMESRLPSERTLRELRERCDALGIKLVLVQDPDPITQTVRD